jgi:hypothetical protein
MRLPSDGRSLILAAVSTARRKPGGKSLTPTGGAPFRFDLAGAVSAPEQLPEHAGVRLFARRYAQEWARWHGAGCGDLTLCDAAAFNAALLHSFYFDPAPWSETRAWLETAFGLRGSIYFPGGLITLTPGSRAILRRLRPTSAKAGRPRADADELLGLAAPAEHLLIQGGDSRLALDARTLLNGYGCRPFPRPEAITFSSSTASSISGHAFAATEAHRAALIAHAIRDGVGPALTALADEVRADILTRLAGDAQRAEAVLCSSGTDCFLVAQGLVHLITDKPVSTLIVGANESGTGVPLAAQERHFSVRAALGGMVARGDKVDSAEPATQLLDIPLRDEKGRVRSAAQVDAEVRRAVAERLAGEGDVVLHAMNHSKLGAAGPSPALIFALKKHWGARLHVIVDACQMRLELDELRRYLKAGCTVIVTGSKFFTGPPLSGAVLIPRAIAEAAIASGRAFPEGFNAYCAALDFPARLRPLLRRPTRACNIGNLMRWVAANAEIARYLRIPAPVRRRALDRFCGEIEALFRRHPAIELHDAAPRRASGRAGEFAGRRMIFPFYLVRRAESERVICTEAEVRRVYALLNEDCTGRFAADNARDYRLLAQRCHVGQPVKLPHPSGQATAVLRISIGARIVSEGWSDNAGRVLPELLADEVWQVGVVLDKIELLLRKLTPPPA